MLEKSSWLKSGWFKSGLVSAASVFLIMWISILVCRSSDSQLCNRWGVLFDGLNKPALWVTDPVLHKIGWVLGVRKLGPDFEVAPLGVTTTLHILGWFSFLLYWFTVGVCVYWIGRGVKRFRSARAGKTCLRLTNTRDHPFAGSPDVSPLIAWARSIPFWPGPCICPWS
jgi:hypothetical protein